MKAVNVRSVKVPLVLAGGFVALAVALFAVSNATPDVLGVKVDAVEAVKVWGGQPPPDYCTWHKLVTGVSCNSTFPNYCSGTYYNCFGKRCGYVCPGWDSLGPAPPADYWGLAYFDPEIDCPYVWEMNCGEHVVTHECVCLYEGGSWVLCQPDPADLNETCLIWYC